MRALVYLVVVVMLVSSACKPLVRNHESYAQQERQERMSWKKKALIIAGAGLAVFGGYRLAKYLDQVVGIKMIEDMGRISFFSRPPKNFAISEDKLPLYKLTAPDSSEHWLVGTMHTPAVSLHDLPEQSRLRAAFEKSTAFLPETDLDSYMGIVRQAVSQARMQKSVTNTKFDLRQALGDEYMAKLHEDVAPVIAQIKDAHQGIMTKEVQATLDALATIDQMTPGNAHMMLEGFSGSTALGMPGSAIDMELLMEARQAGKKVFGLESTKEVASALKHVTEGSDDSAAIAKFKRFIDDGGVMNRITEYEEARAAYVRGDVDTAHKLVTLNGSNSAGMIKKLLDDRNHNWIKSGKIQKNCRQGNQCMVAVGLSHLVGEGDNLITLLTKEGFKVEKL
ncbi:MAG: TraB/GumN family protein [Pseudomonadota bacterium]|nr:TraB/GumN family protein [Pseudomonadota bacterium]